MTTPREPDSILATWLEEGPTELPETTRRAIAVATRTTTQHQRPMWTLWRTHLMNPFSKVALAALAIVVVVAGGVYFLAPGGQVGGPSPAPAPSSAPPSSAPPSPAPQGAVPTEWATYTSFRFEYSIDHPAAWGVTPATNDWTSGGLHPEGKNLDRFGVTPTGTRVLVSSTPITPAQSSADRIAELDAINVVCRLSDRHDITLDGATGRQEDFFCFGVDYGIEVVVANESRHFQIDLFSKTPLGETDKAIFQRFLDSFRFGQEAAVWQTFVSDRFGYSVELPGEWAITTTADDLPDDVYPGPETEYADRWDPPVTRTPWFIIAVRDPAPEETVDDWVARYEAGLATACSTLSSNPVQVDGAAGVLRAGPCLLPGVDIVDVLVVHNGRAYTLSIAGISGDAATNRSIFDQILSTFRFTG